MREKEMFERYTEKARRVIFFARYEASVLGAHSIDSSHMLLGLLREDRELFLKLLHYDSELLLNAAGLMGLKPSGEKVSTSVDLPFTTEAKRVLVFAAEEAESMGDPHVGTGHVLLGLLREPGSARDLLAARGLELTAARKSVAEKERVPVMAPANRQIVGNLRTDFRAAMAGRLKPELEPAVSYNLLTEKGK
jgi:ATP-dependent Clp protease ATP-binding subunit ClpC